MNNFYNIPSEWRIIKIFVEAKEGTDCCVCMEENIKM